MSKADEAGVLDCFAHLPGVALGEDEGALPLGRGEVTVLPFATWTELDPHFDSWKFQRLRPVFFTARLDVDPDEFSDRTYDRWSAILNTAYEALLLAEPARLPDPRLSVTYMRVGESTRRYLGPFGRDTLKAAPAEAAVLLDGETAARAGRIWASLEHSTLRSVPEVDAAIATLERTARPEFDLFNDFVHNAILLESMLMPDVRRDLTESFARRGAVLFSDHDDELATTAERCRAVYRFRSEAVHGGDPVAVVPDGWSLDQFLYVPRVLTAFAVRRLLAFATTVEDDAGDAFRRGLVDGWDDAQVRARLRAIWANA